MADDNTARSHRSSSNKCTMKMIGIHIAPAKGLVNPLFETKRFVDSCQKGTNHDFECHCNQQPINKECETFSSASISGVHTKRGLFSKHTVFKFMRFVSVFEKLYFHRGAM